jgi:hypothetical protein
MISRFFTITYFVFTMSAPLVPFHLFLHPGRRRSSGMVCGGGDISSGSISPQWWWVSVSPTPSRRSSLAHPMSGSASPQLCTSPPAVGSVSPREQRGQCRKPCMTSPLRCIFLTPTLLLSPPLPPMNGFDGETNPTRAAQESPTGKGKPRAADIVGVGWSPHYFSKKPPYPNPNC